MRKTIKEMMREVDRVQKKRIKESIAYYRLLAIKLQEIYKFEGIKKTAPAMCNSTRSSSQPMEDFPL